jgi:hypothetical protein
VPEPHPPRGEAPLALHEVVQAREPVVAGPRRRGRRRVDRRGHHLPPQHLEHLLARERPRRAVALDDVHRGPLAGLARLRRPAHPADDQDDADNHGASESPHAQPAEPDGEAPVPAVGAAHRSAAAQHRAHRSHGSASFRSHAHSVTGTPSPLPPRASPTRAAARPGPAPIHFITS